MMRKKEKRKKKSEKGVAQKRERKDDDKDVGRESKSRERASDVLPLSEMPPGLSHISTILITLCHASE